MAYTNQPECFSDFDPDHYNTERRKDCQYRCPVRKDCKEAKQKSDAISSPPQQSAWSGSFAPRPPQQTQYNQQSQFSQQQQKPQQPPYAASPSPQPIYTRPIQLNTQIESPWSRLGKESAASALSAIGHQIYEFFRVFRFQPPPPSLACGGCKAYLPQGAKFCAQCGSTIR